MASAGYEPKLACEVFDLTADSDDDLQPVASVDHAPQQMVAAARGNSGSQAIETISIASSPEQIVNAIFDDVERQHDESQAAKPTQPANTTTQPNNFSATLQAIFDAASTTVAQWLQRQSKAWANAPLSQSPTACSATAAPDTLQSAPVTRGV